MNKEDLYKTLDEYFKEREAYLKSLRDGTVDKAKIAEFIRKDLTTSSAAIVPEEWVKEVDVVAENAGFARKYASYIKLGANETHIPYLSTDVTFYTVDETDDITKCDPVISDADAVLEQWCGLTIISNKLIANASIEVVDFLSAAFGRKLALYEDEKLYDAVKAGASNSIDLGGSGIAYDDLVNTVATLEGYAANPVWFVSPSFYAAVKKLKDSNNHPLFNYEEKTLLGYPIFVSTVVEATGTDDHVVAIFGDFKHALVGERNGAEIYVSKEGAIGSTNLLVKNLSALRYVVYGKAVCINGAAFVKIIW